MKQLYDIDVKNLKQAGFMAPYDQFGEPTKEILKLILMDAVLGFVTGLHSIPKEELDGLKRVIATEPQVCRPIWPLGTKTSLEMSGFLNSYCLRYPDMTDTLRMIHPKLDAGGHPSDMMAVIFTMCDWPGVTGKKILECINVGYQMWSVLMNGMLTDRNLDASTGLSFVTPVIAAVSMGDEPKKVQNALNLSVAGGVMLGRVRSTDDMTNLKSAAAGYAIAKSLWCYRMSDVIEAPATIFTGDRGSWYKVVAPLDRPFKAVPEDDLYQMIEFKMYPCFNVAQAPVECAISLHNRLNGDVSRIVKIVLRKSAVEAKIPFRPDRPKYPHDHPTADHHMEYCVSAGLCFGALTPKHYEDEYIQNETVRHLIDITELKVFSDEELAAMGGNTGACSLEVWLDDGTVLKDERRHSLGNVIGVPVEERKEIMSNIIAKKKDMVEGCYGCDLSDVATVINNFEERNASDLIDVLQAVLSIGD